MSKILKLQMLSSQNSFMDEGANFGSAISTICPSSPANQGEPIFEMQ
jgi:hypothetical protein